VPIGAVTDATEYAEWLDRVRATYEAVRYTCSHRLDDPTLADPVAVQVTAGLLARPSVFRYFGLPFSGRIARLAEARIAEADAGELASVCGWTELRERLETMPVRHRRVLVATCLRGDDDRALAVVLGCDEPTARAEHETTLAFMRELARPGLPPVPDPDERS
jgi:hypothetical protein